eukprot:TRINITY_DN7011_c0_g2_i1.p1 TRINITY_DN7011_c0_g2~~TRINITY_DN7011_c0_g2_i1.p1  ORF type:complete len:537 (+),score=75.78 TRINITY_DN7011_c0_g2_i1:123-1733(+)
MKQHLSEDERSPIQLQPDEEEISCDDAINAIGFGKYQIKLMLVSGLCWMSDAMETMLLSFISAPVACEWQLNRAEQALITTIVFLGMLIGAYFWGTISDRFGRKKAYLATVSFTFAFGALSSVSPSYGWLLFFRGLVGIGIGGAHVSFTIFAEFLPGSKRAIYLIMFSLFWAFGSVVEAGLAWAILPVLGWRWLLAISSLPLLAALLLYPLVPESTRYLQLSGRGEEAMNELRKAAKMNNKSGVLPEVGAGRVKLALAPGGHDRGRVTDLCLPTMRLTTALLWFIWFANAFCYYGAVLMVSQLFTEERLGRRCNDGSLPVVVEDNPIDDMAEVCEPLGDTEYLDIFITSASEIPGILITAFIIGRLGRKKTQALDFFVVGICAGLLCFCTGRAVETVLFAIFRGFITGGFQVMWVYTPEVYPTTIRSTGIGMCASVSRIGGMITPYVAQLLSQYNVYLSLGFYAIFAWIAGMCSLFLPVETTGRHLPNTVQDFDESKRDATPASPVHPYESPLLEERAKRISKTASLGSIDFDEFA